MQPLTWLYVPGDRPERFDSALSSGADVVIVDLEDAVAPAHKAPAREQAVRWLATAPSGRVEVRVNALGTPWAEADLHALTDAPALRAVRLPKVESSDDVRAATEWLAAQRCGLSCLIETARGVEAAYQIATASRVTAIGLGEADLAGDLGVDGPDGLIWARSRVVVAARAAGLPAPAMSVYPHVHDLDGLRDSSFAGRRLGLVGRAAIHPRQVPVIAAAFAPSAAELDDARTIVESYAKGAAAGNGVVVLDDGRMVDAAMIVKARRVLQREAGRPDADHDARTG